MAITWRNIDAPDLRGVSSLMGQAGDAFSGALDSLSNLGNQQRNVNIAQQEQRTDENTQQALEAIKNIGTIEQYQNTSFPDLVAKYGNEINREELFKAFDARDEQIYEEKDFLAKRALNDDIRNTNTTVDSFISEGLLGGKTQEELKQGVEALIADKPTAVKAAAREAMLSQFEYSNQLTPEGQMLYDNAIKTVDSEYQVQESNLLDAAAEQQAIIDRDPLKGTTDLRSEMTWNEYVNKYAPDQFELDWNKYEGDDIDDLVSEARKDKGLLNQVKRRIAGTDANKLSGYTIPEDVIAHVIMSARRTTDNKLLLGDFEDRVVDTAAQYYAYSQDAMAAKKNLSTIRESQVRLGNEKSKSYLRVRDQIKNLKSSENNLKGTR